MLAITSAGSHLVVLGLLGEGLLCGSFRLLDRCLLPWSTLVGSGYIAILYDVAVEHCS